jgi:hypothetical protein
MCGHHCPPSCPWRKGLVVRHIGTNETATSFGSGDAPDLTQAREVCAIRAKIFMKIFKGGDLTKEIL